MGLGQGGRNLVLHFELVDKEIARGVPSPRYFAGRGLERVRKSTKRFSQKNARQNIGLERESDSKKSELALE